MWMLSKCTHITGVQFVSRPEAKVSAASKKLKSPGAKGRGAGQNGRMERRNRNADAPTATIDSPFLLANRPNACSTLKKKEAPSRGHANETAIAIAARPASKLRSDGPCCEAAAGLI